MEPTSTGQQANDRLTIIGVGNEFRSDDALGLLVARELKRRHPDAVTILEADGEGASLMETWKGRDAVLIIDALSSGGPPGSVRRLDAASIPVPAGLFHYSSHAFGVAEAIEMARRLHQLPRIALLYGIEGASFEAGVGLSDPVVKSIPGLISTIQRDLKHLLPA